jgi:hypothetical protein
MQLDIFPCRTPTLAIAVTATSSTSAALPGSGRIVRLVNEGPNNCYVSIGSGSQTATVPPTSDPVATCSVVLAGEDLIFSIPQNGTTPLNIAAICRATATATLLVQVAEGV